MLFHGTSQTLLFLFYRIIPTVIILYELYLLLCVERIIEHDHGGLVQAPVGHKNNEEHIKVAGHYLLAMFLEARVYRPQFPVVISFESE